MPFSLMPIYSTWISITYFAHVCLLTSMAEKAISSYPIIWYRYVWQPVMMELNYWNNERRDSVMSGECLDCSDLSSLKDEMGTWGDGLVDGNGFWELWDLFVSYVNCQEISIVNLSLNIWQNLSRFKKSKFVIISVRYSINVLKSCDTTDELPLYENFFFLPFNFSLNLFERYQCLFLAFTDVARNFRSIFFHSSRPRHSRSLCFRCKSLSFKLSQLAEIMDSSLMGFKSGGSHHFVNNPNLYGFLLAARTLFRCRRRIEKTWDGARRKKGKNFLTQLKIHSAE